MVGLGAKSPEGVPARWANLTEATVRAIIGSLSMTLLLSMVISIQAQMPDRPDQEKARGTSAPARLLRAGAFAIDITPARFPVLVNGGFLQNQATQIKDPIRAKCLVLDDGTTRLAIVVVDTCMMPRELIDRAKSLAQGEDRHEQR